MKYIIALSIILSAVACGHQKTKNAGAAAAPTTFAKASEIPVENFFRNPTYFGYRISPDGKTLAVLRPYKTRMNIFVHPANDPKALKQITFNEDRDINQVHWKGNDHLIYERDQNGDENDHVFLVDVKNAVVKDLTPFEKTKASLVDDLADSSDTDIIIQHNKRNKEVFDLFRVNINTLDTKMVGENKFNITSWLLDHTGAVRGGAASDGVNSVFYFDKGKGLEPVFKTNFRNEFSPQAFAADNKHLYVLTNLKGDLSAIYEIDPSQKISAAILKKPIFSHANYDVGGATYSPVRKALGSVQVTTDRHEMTFLHPDDQKDWLALKAKFPGETLILANHTIDERTWIFKTTSDRSTGNYFVFNRDSQAMTDLGPVVPGFPAELMGEMKTVHYKSRDGMNIEGYLTIPHGKEAKNLPVVINPHGGPWARDEWGFNPEVQFLASRGYAVFQMNYRGSTGYGRKHWQSSFKQWGKKMQDDITDGVKWLEKTGLADSKKVCIYGASYGGYATLAGVTFTPDLYACAIDYVGVANMFTFMKTVPPYWESFKAMMYVMVGDPVKDKALLRAASPVFFVDKIKAPLFVAQGANDPRVNKAESDQVVEGLRKRGVDVEYMVKENEGHGFSNEENRFDFYRAMEKFLAKHLG